MNQSWKWLLGKSAGIPYNCWFQQGFPVDFPINQPSQPINTSTYEHWVALPGFLVVDGVGSPASDPPVVRIPPSLKLVMLNFQLSFPSGRNQEPFESAPWSRPMGSW